MLKISQDFSQRFICLLLNKWNNLPISFFGRILAIKMTILPKLVYLFETLPVFIHRELRTLQAPLINFIWAHERHIISKSVLLAPKASEDLAIPDLLKYFWAAQLRRVPEWSSLWAYIKWVEIEKLWIAPIHPNSLLWSMSQVKVNVPLLDPMLLIRDIWRSCATRYGLSPTLYSITYFLFNPLLPDGLTGGHYKSWLDLLIQ